MLNAPRFGSEYTLDAGIAAVMKPATNPSMARGIGYVV